MPDRNTKSHRPIKILPPELSNRIAAGEVVERPASVLKELVENSLDAYASRIDVAIERGGQGLVMVQDDGYGMTPEEMELAVTRHATSKISEPSDLDSIASFGFRGEALPSIASVSSTTVSSMTSDADSGSFIQIESGKIVERGPAAMRPGTRIEVRDLFASVPARLKFLKTHATETRRCQDVFCRLALARLDLRMEMSVGGKTAHNFTAGQDLASRLAEVWPPAVCKALMPVEGELDGIRVSGLAGSPSQAQGRADRLYFYVGGRPVSDKLLISAVREAYSGRLLTREYPQAALFVELDPELVDVNVHPAKSEVRFRDERTVFRAVRKAVLDALQSASIQVPDFGFSSDDGLPRTGGSFSQKKPEGHAVYAHAPEPAKFSTWDTFREEAPAQGYLDAAPRPESTPEPEKLYAVQPPAGGPAYLGQLGNTYLILRTDDRLLLVDQHAAHERVLFDTFRKAGGRGESRPLAMPLTLSLHPAETRRLEEIWPDLKKLGFNLDASEPGVLSVREVPACLSTSAARDYLSDALSGKTDSTDGMWALMACKSAVKAGQSLARDEALSLLEAWRALPGKDYCPHGRPVTVTWSMDELEKLFKRKP